MRVRITARHTSVEDGLRIRAEELMEKVGKLAHRPHRAEVIFDEGHHRRIVELHVFSARGSVLVANAEADTFFAALDRAVEKLRHQLNGKAKKPGARWRATR